MKFAVKSDIQRKVFALNAVISDVPSHNVNFMVKLGDILYGSAAPKDTCDLLLRNDMITICEN